MGKRNNRASSSTCCDKWVTFASGLSALALITYVSTIHPSSSSPGSQSGGGNSIHSIYGSNNNQSWSFVYYDRCNGSDQQLLLEKAKQFDLDHRDKVNFLDRVRHRLTHREEAIHALISLTFILVSLTLAVLSTKMWREKEHHPLTFRQDIKFPTTDDPRSQIKFKDVWKSKGRNLVAIWKDRRLRAAAVGGDQADSGSVYVRTLPESDDNDESHVYAMNPRTGEWSAEAAAFPDPDDVTGSSRHPDHPNDGRWLQRAQKLRRGLPLFRRNRDQQWSSTKQQHAKFDSKEGQLLLLAGNSASSESDYECN